MKVTGLETLVIQNDPPFWGGERWLFIRISTDEGIVGLGERPTIVGKLGAQIAMIQDLFDEYVLGEDPFQIERVYHRMFAGRHDYRHPSMDSTPAISAIEMALWDIVGKALDQPIYNLLGGCFHERLPAYAYMPFEGVWEDPRKAGDVARQLIADGWTTTKFDCFFPLEPFYPREWPLKDLERAASIFRAIREAVGNELEVGLGTHGQFTTAGAIRCASILEEYRPAWFEEPVPPENVEEMARVAAHTSIPIASGERLATIYDFANLLEKQAAQIIQLDVAQCGGILQSKKIAAIAEAHHATIAPHMYVGPIAGAAAIQFDACTPNFKIQEYNTGAFHREIIENPIVAVDGSITPPSAPGLGITLNEEVVRQRTVR
jgi:2-dehydro-3-deoxyphosphogalactonate aldolase